MVRSYGVQCASVYPWRAERRLYRTVPWVISLQYGLGLWLRHGVLGWFQVGVASYAQAVGRGQVVRVEELCRPLGWVSSAMVFSLWGCDICAQQLAAEHAGFDEQVRCVLGEQQVVEADMLHVVVLWSGIIPLPRSV